MAEKLDATPAGGELPERYRLWSTVLKPQEKAAGYTRHFRALVQESSADAAALTIPWNEAMDPLDWMMRHDQRFYLPDCLMVKVDIASMAHSLGVRCPLLDHPLVEFAARIPSALKRDASGGKLIFKRAVASLLPPAVVARRKTGFGVPLGRWLRGEFSEFLRRSLLDERAQRRNLIAPNFIGRLIDEHVTGRRDWSTRLWALLCLELWFREFVD